MSESRDAAASSHDSIDGEPRQVVHSPEQVALHLPVAGPTSRMLAYGIDSVAIALLTAAVIALLFLFAPVAAWVLGLIDEVGGELRRGEVGRAESSEALLLIVVALIVIEVLVEWGYFIVCELVSGGRSPGKAVVGLRVIGDGGMPLTLQQSMVRNFLRAVDILPASYLAGLVTMVLSRDVKRLGDIAAGTVVVRMDRAPLAAPVISEQPPDEAFRFDRAQMECVGSAELALARQTLRRWDELAAEVREPMLERSVETIRSRIGYGPVDPALRRAFLQSLLHAARSR